MKSKYPEILLFLENIKAKELNYFNQIIRRNKDNRQFQNSPAAVMPELKSVESLGNLDKALDQISKIENSFKSIGIHNSFVIMDDRIRKFIPDTPEFKLSMKAEEILDAENKLTNAEKWLKRFGHYQNLIKQIKGQKGWEEFEETVNKAAQYILTVKPYTLEIEPLASDAYSVGLTQNLNILKKRNKIEVVKESPLAKPLAELKAELEKLKQEKDVTKEMYSAAVKKLNLVKAVQDTGTEKEKTELASIEKEINGLKPEEKQISVSIKPLQSENPMRFPKVEITTNFPGYCFYAYYIKRVNNGNEYEDEVVILEPVNLTDKKVSFFQSKEELRSSLKERKVIAVCFTYFKDAQAFRNLVEEKEALKNYLKFQREKMESFLKKLNPKTYAVKELVLKK